MGRWHVRGAPPMAASIIFAAHYFSTPCLRRRSSGHTAAETGRRRHLLRLEPARLQLAGGFEDGISDRADVRKYPLEVAQDVEVQRARFNCGGQPLAQSSEMVLGGRALHLANHDLSLHKLPRDLHIAAHEDGERKF